MQTASTAAPPASQPSPGKSQLTRSALIALGQSGRAWDFLPVAARALDQVPTDDDVRLLVASVLGTLKLRTLALEQLELLHPTTPSNPDAIALRAMLEAMPSDLIPASELEATARANLDALAARGDFDCAPLRAQFDAWRAGLNRQRIHRSGDANIVRTAHDPAPSAAPISAAPLSAAPLSAAQGLINARALAEATLAQLLPPNRPDPFPQPVTFEGIDRPWLLAAFAAATPPTAIGYQPRIDILHGDPLEFLDALALADLRGVLSQERVRLWLGPDCVRNFVAWLAEQKDSRAVGALVQSPLRPASTPPLSTALQQVARAHDAANARARVQAETFYSGKAASYWAQRYAEALAPGSAAPLRILVCSTILSTYVRHAAADLTDALTRAGCQVNLLIEPDRCSRMSALAYWRRFAEFKPDLVVTINYTRFNMKDVVPAGVPYVCWMQDPMPHLMTEANGLAQGPLDFSVGTVFPELFSKFKYPVERALSTPLIASSTKFHDRPAEEQLHSELACEVAFVSHHAETPDQLHARLTRDTASMPALASVFAALKPRIESILERAMEDRPTTRIVEAADELLRRALGAEPSEHIRSIVHRQYALTLADRIFRHQAVEWAARICRRRGWRLGLFGKGWDRVASLAEFARGPLEHAEPLRACYRAAAIHLHVSFNTMLHQRMLECALAGGLCTPRLHADFCATPKYLHVQLLSEGHTPLTDADARVGWPVDAHPALREFIAMRTRLGLPTLAEDGVLWISGERHRAILGLGPIVGPQHNAWALLGDPARACFWDERSLEERIEMAVERPEERRAAADAVRARALAGYTHDAFAASMLSFVRQGLAAGNKAARPPAFSTT